jgi:hypothetical protein
MDSEIIWVRGQSLSEMWGSRLGCLLVKVMVGRPYSIPLKLTLFGLPDFSLWSWCPWWSNAFGGSTIIDSRYNTSSQKFSEIFLKPALLQPIPVCMMIA